LGAVEALMREWEVVRRAVENSRPLSGRTSTITTP
jgi:hypothetical protein